MGRLRGLALAAALGLTAPLWMSAFPAPAHPCTVDLKISDSHGGTGLTEETEDTRGAFTVLNRNDTDKDGDEDLGQSTVDGEIDLMKLVLKQTDPVSEVAVLNVGGIDKVKLWSSATKGTEVAPDDDGGGSTWTFESLPQTLWVEGIEVSDSVRDVTFDFEGLHKEFQPPPAPSPMPTTCGHDTASATIVWAEQTDVRHDKKDDVWEDFTNPPKKRLDSHCGGGFGLRPIGGANGVVNCIGIQFTVSPTGVWDEDGVKIDITRQRKQRYWNDPDGKGYKLDQDQAIDFPKGDKPNDDSDDGDEVDSSEAPNADGHFYSFDGPGPKDINAKDKRLVRRWNMLEFVRIRFDGQSFHGSVADGSRCSFKYEWHATHELEKKPFKGNDGVWTRTTGNDEKAFVNDVGPGHMANIGKDP